MMSEKRELLNHMRRTEEMEKNDSPATDPNNNVTTAQKDVTPDEQFIDDVSIKIRPSLANFPPGTAKVIAKQGLLNAPAVAAQNLHIGTLHVKHTIIGTYVSISPAEGKEKAAELAQQLKYYYIQNDSKIQRILGNALSLGDCFVNLAIVKSAQQKQAELEKLKSQPDRLKIDSSYEEIYSIAKKDVIHPVQLFDEREKKIPKKIAIVGRAGIGKSVLSQYLSAYLWAVKDLWSDQFDIVIKVKLRNLTAHHYNKDSSLAEIITLECLDRSGLTVVLNKADIAATLQNCSKKSLFILDGLDEFNPNTSPCSKIITNLLNNPNASIIVLTRPYTELNSKDFDLHLECIGFTDENINQYIEKVCEDKTQIPFIKDFLRRNLPIHSLAHIPIITDMICGMWDEEMRTQNQPMTITQLYNKMLTKLWVVYKKKQLQQHPNISQHELNKKKDKAKEFLTFLAYTAMNSDSIMLSFDLVKQAIKTVYRCQDEDVQDYLEEVLPPGFLNTPDHNRKNGRYYFPHLTFQEFLMAQYLVNQSDAFISQWISEYKYQAKYQLVLIFMCGLIVQKDGVEGIKKFFNILEQPPRDLVGVYHDILVAHCLNECEDKIQLCSSANSFLQLLNRLEAKLDHEVNQYQHPRLIKSDIGFLPYLYQSKLIDFFINQLGNDKGKNKEAMSALTELGIPHDKKLLICSKLLKEYYLESIKSHIEVILVDMSQNEIDNLVDQLIARWPKKGTTDISANYTIEIAEALAKKSSKNKKQLIIEKLIIMLDEEYIRKDVAKGIAGIGIPIADSIIEKLLLNVSNKNENDEHIFDRGEYFECLGHLYILAKNAHKNMIITVIINDILDGNFYGLCAIKTQFNTISNQDKSLIISTFPKTFTDRKYDYLQKYINEIIIENYMQIPENLKAVFNKVIAERELTFSLEFLLKIASNNEKWFADFTGQFAHLVNYEISYDKKDEIKRLSNSLNPQQIILLLKFIIKRLDKNKLNDLIILLISQYPHHRIGDIINEFLIGFEYDNKNISEHCAKYLSILLTEKLFPLVVKQKIFSMVCDHLEKKPQYSAKILDAFEKMDKELEPCLSRLISIKLKLIQENIYCNDKNLMLKLLKFSCSFVTFYASGKYISKESYDSYTSLVTNEQIIILQSLLEKICEQEFNIDYGYCHTNIREATIKLISELASTHQTTSSNSTIDLLIKCSTHADWETQWAALNGLTKIAVKLSDAELHQIINKLTPLVSTTRKNTKQQVIKTILDLYAQIQNTQYLEEYLTFTINIFAIKEKKKENDHDYTIDDAAKIISQYFDKISTAQIVIILECIIRNNSSLLKQTETLLVMIVSKYYNQEQQPGLISRLNPFNNNKYIQTKIDNILEMLLSYLTRIEYRKGLVENYVNDNWLAEPYVEGTVRETNIRSNAYKILAEIIKYLSEDKFKLIITRSIDIFWSDHSSYSDRQNLDERDNIETTGEWLRTIGEHITHERKRFIINTLMATMKPGQSSFVQVFKILTTYKDIVTEQQSQSISDTYFKIKSGNYSNIKYIRYTAREIIIFMHNNVKEQFINKLITAAEKGDKTCIEELPFIFKDVVSDKKKSVFLLLFKKLSKYDLDALYSQLPSQEDKRLVISCIIEILFGNTPEEDKLKIPEMLTGKDIPDDKKLTVINAILKLKSNKYSNSIADEVKSFLKAMNTPELFSIYMLHQTNISEVQSTLLYLLRDRILEDKQTIVCTQNSATITIDIYAKHNKITLQFSQDCRERLAQFVEYTNKTLLASIDMSFLAHHASLHSIVPRV